MSKIKGVKAPLFKASYFKEFPVSYMLSQVDKINHRLLDHKILGGKSLKTEFPELGNSALYCVSELHTKDQIDILCEILANILEG